MEKMKNAYKIENMEVRGHLGNLHEDEQIILK
jgi:hypothetical protein